MGWANQVMLATNIRATRHQTMKTEIKAQQTDFEMFTANNIQRRPYICVLTMFGHHLCIIRVHMHDQMKYIC